MRAVLILPFAGLIFLAGYITARYSIVNRVIDSASLFVVELCNVLFRVAPPFFYNALILQSYLVIAALGLTLGFLLILVPLERIAEVEANSVG